MSNMNTFAGFQNLPAITWTFGATATGYVIPASGVYSTLPSPTQVAGNWLVVPALPGDVNGGVLDNGRPFRVRINGVLNAAQSETLTVDLYQATAAKFAAGVTATANGTKIMTTGLSLATGAALKTNFFLDAVLMWDSQSKTLNGFTTGQAANATFTAFTKTTQVTALTENDLNFFPVFTLGTGTGDILGPIDISIDRY